MSTPAALRPASILLALAALTACGAASSSAPSAEPRNPPPPATTATAPAETETEAEIFARAEDETRRALAACPRARLGAPDTAPCDAAALDAATARVGALLDRVLATRSLSVRTHLGASASPDCVEERAHARDAWRETAIMLRMTIGVDCAIAGQEQVPTCAAQARSPLHRLALAALELASSEPPLRAGVDAFGRAIDDAAQAGSLAMQMDWFGMAVSSALSASITSDTCVALAEWNAGAGLAPHTVDGTGFALDLPAGSTSEDGVASGPYLLSLGVGTSSQALDAIASAMPESCRPLADESRDGFRLFDCAGPDLVSENREIWALTDLGALRAVATARVRHQSAGLVVTAMASRLRTLRRAEPAAPFDLARWGLRGTTEGWTHVVVDHLSHLVLADALPPTRATRWLQFITAPDPSLCGRARERNAATPASQLVVIDDTTLDGGGCDIAIWNPEPRGGGVLVVLRVEATSEGATIAQYYAPLPDEPTARTTTTTARTAIDTALHAPAPTTRRHRAR